MVNNAYLCLLILSVIAHSYVAEQECARKISQLDNYDHEKAKGAWYVVEIGDEKQSIKKCMLAVLSDGDIKETGIVGGKEYNLDVTFSQVKSTSQYIAESPEFSLTSAWVIETDYNSYATWFLCRPGHEQDGVLYVTTRDRQPAEEVLNKAHESLTKSGFIIDNKYLYSVEQSAC